MAAGTLDPSQLAHACSWEPVRFVVFFFLAEREREGTRERLPLTLFFSLSRRKSKGRISTALHLTSPYLALPPFVPSFYPLKRFFKKRERSAALETSEERRRAGAAGRLPASSGETTAAAPGPESCPKTRPPRSFARLSTRPPSSGLWSRSRQRGFSLQRRKLERRR